LRKFPILELANQEAKPRVMIDERSLSKQVAEALGWISVRYDVPTPRVSAVNAMLSVNGTIMDGVFIVGATEKAKEGEPIILLSRRPGKQVVWVLFHEFYHYRHYLKTGVLPNFIAINSLEEREADRFATIDFRAYNSKLK